MSDLLADAGLLAPAPAADAAWRMLLDHVFAEARVSFRHAAPGEAVMRAERGCVLASADSLALHGGVPLAAPVPATAWADGRAVTRTEFVVLADCPIRTLADTGGRRLGLGMPGTTARRYLASAVPTGLEDHAFAGDEAILAAMLSGEVEVGALDGYWLDLLRQHRPEAAGRLRSIAVSGPDLPPVFAAAPSLPANKIGRLKIAFARAEDRDWFPPIGQVLRLAGFAAMEQED